MARDVGKRVVIAASTAFQQDKTTFLAALKRRGAGRLSYVTLRMSQNLRKLNSWGAYRHALKDPLLLEAAMQQMELFRLAAGADARSVYAQSWNTLWGDYKGDTSALVTFEMENGVRCLYEGSVVASASLHPWGRELVRAECEGCSIQVENQRVWVSIGDTLGQPRHEEIPLVAGDSFGHAWLAEQFCDWCGGAQVPPPTHLKEHIQAVAMAFAAVESGDTGKVVDVQAFLKSHLDEARREVRSQQRAGTATHQEYDSTAPGELPV
jgi:hypothetical protein